MGLSQGAQRIIATALGLLLLAGVVLFVVTRSSNQESEPVVVTESVADPAPAPTAPDPQIRTVGTSVEGRSISAYTYGTGDTHLLFVGGIHGGYEWNSVLLAYTLIDHLTAQPDLVSTGLSVTVIPVANPDGLYKVLGKEGRFTLNDVPVDEGTPGTGRFNSNNVDLNRNFACKWQPESTWRGTPVSAGTAAFSEPEAAAIRDVVTDIQPVAAVFFHSQSNAVYASECEQGVLPQTRTVMNLYADAAGYPAVDSFDAYSITGDAEGWLASIGIPAVTVELATHETVEWEKNKAGVEALIAHFRATAGLGL